MKKKKNNMLQKNPLESSILKAMNQGLEAILFLCPPPHKTSPHRVGKRSNAHSFQDGAGTPTEQSVNNHKVWLTEAAAPNLSYPLEPSADFWKIVIPRAPPSLPQTGLAKEWGEGVMQAAVFCLKAPQRTPAPSQDEKCRTG